MREKIWLCLIILFSVKVVRKDTAGANITTESNSKCWMSLMTQHLFQNLEKIDKQYVKIRDDVKQYLDKMNYTTRILEIMLIKGAVVHHGIPHQEPHGKIPSGLSLGGRCTMILPTLVVFFHHMKLREDAFFRVKDLYNDFEKMVLKGHLLLNGLYLTGAYDTSLIDHDPSNLKHTPSFGELQINLKDVEYSLEARYRLKKNRFVIVFSTSNLQTKNISVTHTNANKTDTPIWLNAQHMGDFMTRLKTDLNQWMQDYFNDCLSVISVEDVPSISKIREYDRYKTEQVSVFADNAIIGMNKKLRNIGGDTIRIPSYKITSSHGLSIDLFAGTLRGLETLYRRSEATALYGRNNLHYMDTIVGFKDLKISYAYDINYPQGTTTPQYSNGVLIMSANKQIAHLSLNFQNETKNVELDIDFLNRMRANDITIEGAADILTTNFEHILHHEIATIMANSLQAQDLLKTLPKCDPVGMLKKDIKIQIIEVKPTWKGQKDFKRMNLGELKSTNKMMSL